MEYLAKMEEIQNYILEFLDEEGEEAEIKFRDLESLLRRSNKFDKYELKSVLYLISKIAKNHRRSSVFFDKIKKMILIFKDLIKQAFSYSDIFNIFKNNKLILLILFDESILLIDEYIINNLKKRKYYEYFKRENEGSNEEENSDNFEEKRRKGENDSYICDLIRSDNIDDFIVYYNKNMISLDMQIKPSIFETNSFLLKREPTLIEYSAFYGSIKIFNFLRMNNVDMNKSLWLYSIHGRNPEIIHLLEENHVETNDEIYEECLKESIKCHHNDFAIYYKNNFYKEVDIHSNYFHNDINYGFRFYNFEFIPKDLNEKIFFFYSVQYRHFKLVDYFNSIEGFNINETVIFKLISYNIYIFLF